MSSLDEWLDTGHGRAGDDNTASAHGHGQAGGAGPVVHDQGQGPSRSPVVGHGQNKVTGPPDPMGDEDDDDLLPPDLGLGNLAAEDIKWVDLEFLDLASAPPASSEKNRNKNAALA